MLVKISDFVESFQKPVMLDLPIDLLIIILTLLPQPDASRFICTCRRLRKLRRFYSWVMNETQFLRASRAAATLYLRPAHDTEGQKLLQKLEKPRILCKVRILHIARWLDARHLLPNTNIHTIYYYGNRGILPTMWPPTLRTLILRDIVTTQIEGDFSNLRVFSCNNSRMRELPKMPQLLALYARHTKLDRIPDHEDLHRVNISHTLVEMVPNLMKLTHLDVSYTLVSIIPDCLICLEHLNISSSQVTKLSPAYRHLRVLKAMDTELRWIPAYPKLEVLYIRGSTIVELPRMPWLRCSDVEAVTTFESNDRVPASRSKIPMVAVVG